MPTDSRAVTPSSGSASASPKIIVPPTVELTGRRWRLCLLVSQTTEGQSGTDDRRLISFISKNASMCTRPLKPYRRASFQSLIERVHFNARRFEGCYPQQRLDIRVAEYNGAAGELAHEFDLPDPDVEFEFGPIGQLVCPLALRLKADGCEVLPWDEAIRRPSINQKQPFPSAVRCRRIANGYGDVRGSHVRSFFKRPFPHYSLELPRRRLARQLHLLGVGKNLVHQLGRAPSARIAFYAHVRDRRPRLGAVLRVVQQVSKPHPAELPRRKTIETGGWEFDF